MPQQRRNVCGYLMWMLIALPGLLLAGDAPSIGEMQARIGALLEYREPIQIDYTMTRQDFYETSQILSKGEDGRVRIANPNLIVNGKPHERDGVIDEATGLPYATFSSTYAFFRFGDEVLKVDFAPKLSGKAHFIEASLGSEFWELNVQRPGTEKEYYEPLPRVKESLTSHLELASYLAFCREALEAVDPGALTAGDHVQQRYTSFFDHYRIDE